jgi:DNA-binding NtrC family response regulator
MRPDEKEHAVEVLSVNPHAEDQRALRDIFRHSNWTLYQVPTIGEAGSILAVHQVPVILCEYRLPDGTWIDLRDHFMVSLHPPRIIVTTPYLDERLGAEALDLGAYDVLVKPYMQKEMYRLVSLAWLSAKHTWGRNPQMTPPLKNLPLYY